MTSLGRSSVVPKEHYLRLWLLNAPNKHNGFCNCCDQMGMTPIGDGLYCAIHAIEHRILDRWSNGKCNNSMKVYIWDDTTNPQASFTHNGHKLCDYPGCRYYGDLIPTGKADYYCGKHHRQMTKRALSQSTPIDKPKKYLPTGIGSEPPSPRKTRQYAINKTEIVAPPPGFEPPLPTFKIKPISELPIFIQMIIKAFRENRIQLNDRNFKTFMQMTVSQEYERDIINGFFS